jgi:hypothetical protein
MVGFCPPAGEPAAIEAGPVQGKGNRLNLAESRRAARSNEKGGAIAGTAFLFRPVRPADELT